MTNRSTGWVWPALPPSRYGAPDPTVWRGALEEHLRAAVDAAGGWSVGVVTDPGVRAAGIVDRALRALDGLVVAVWDDVASNPTASSIARADDGLPEVDVLIGLGGGSALDTAKGVALRRADGPDVLRWAGPHGAEEASRYRWVPQIAVPTTAGTGSELQSFALVSRDADHAKVACGCVAARPWGVVLDPSLVASCPPSVRREAALDALVHAFEAAVTTARTPASTRTALAALERLWGALESGDDAGLLDGAALAGAAIEASMLGAAHATANALTARYGVPHGLAVAMTLPHVLRYNAGVADDAEVAAVIGVAPSALPLAWEDLLDRHGAPRDASGWGSRPDDLEALVGAALAQWTGRYNPRPLDADGARQILGPVLGAR